MVAFAKSPEPGGQSLESLELGPIVPDYQPISSTELIALIDQARDAARSEDGATLASIHIRLDRGISGMTSPRPIDGPIADRLNTLDEQFVAAVTSGEFEQLAEQLEPLLR